jgi:hypothetical protein
MSETVLARLRFAPSVLFGKPFSLRSLDRMIDAMLDTYREFGTIASEGKEMLQGPALDEETPGRPTAAPLPQASCSGDPPKALLQWPVRAYWDRPGTHEIYQRLVMRSRFSG